MNSDKFEKKHVILRILFLLLLFLCGFSLLFLLWLRKEINNTETLKSYRITCEDSAARSANLLKRLCREKFSAKLYPASSRSHLYLHLAATKEEAEALGTSTAALTDNGFIIERRGNGLFLLANSEDGLSRACYYLTFRLTDENGTLLHAQDSRYMDTGSTVSGILGPSETPLADYRVAVSEEVPADCAYDLCFYLNQSCGAVPALSKNAKDACGILLRIDPGLTGRTHTITCSDSDIIITGRSEDGLSEGITVFANTYLGYLYAGTPREKITSDVLIPLHPFVDHFSSEDPWISEREPIVTLWNTNFSRGLFLNDSTSLKTNLLSYSDEQLYAYVRMMKFCGFTGIQATDMCSAWAGYGGYEFVHDRLRFMADAAHSLGMNFTLWVWGSEFSGYGWVDNSVTYTSGEYDFAHENPDVLATFDKYYSIYAELADCCDRVIAHYYDPGNLQYSEDVAYFAKELRDKFTAVNPQVRFGVNCWVDKFEKEEFVRLLGNDITLYESGRRDDDIANYTVFRNFCKNTGCSLGTWAWNTCEMEIDQLAQMNYNPRNILSLYQTSAAYDDILKPDYWSEMDSNHVINVFSLYCAGQLLSDPSTDTDQLTRAIAHAAAGPEYASRFADLLCLIEDARYGESYDTYFWNKDDYILKSEAYPAENILARSNEAIALLREMIDADIPAYSLPLPIEFNQVLQLILPQIEQIRSFAEFRIGFSKLKQMSAEGASSEVLSAKLAELSTPVSEYNTVVGAWGQVEARAQLEMIYEFCCETGLDIPLDPVFLYFAKNRIYGNFVSYQKGCDHPILQYAPYYQYGLAFGSDATLNIVQEMIDEGLLTRDETTGGVYLTDWEHYKYAFN